jgi:hypothetical protein
VGRHWLQSDLAMWRTQRQTREPAIATIGGGMVDLMMASIGGDVVDSVAVALQTQWRNPLAMATRFYGTQGESTMAGQEQTSTSWTQWRQ